jgi:hypothetical protein
MKTCYYMNVEWHQLVSKCYIAFNKPQFKNKITRIQNFSSNQSPIDLILLICKQVKGEVDWIYNG